MRRGRLRAVVATLAALIGLGALLALAVDLPPELSNEPPDGFAQPREVVLYGTLPDALSESSGLAGSRSQPGVLWTHNDSGNRARVFAIDSTGQILARYVVRGAVLRDWEDIAVAPCHLPGAGNDCLFIADTGDNLRRRHQTQIYVISEPSVHPAPVGGREQEVEVAQTIRIVLPNGPRDIEALAVHPSGDLYLINKGPGVPVDVMRIPSDELAEPTVTPDVIAQIDVSSLRFLGRLVTGAAFSPDGTRLVVRTYIELLFHLVNEAGVPVPDGPSCFLGLLEPQGEGVDFLTDHTVILGSEALSGRPGTIYGVRCAA